MKAHFIGEEISADWNVPPQREKTPRCPDRFTWRDDTFEVAELLGEWRDYGRRGRMTSNMRPEHARRARLTGSWGVGRFYFRVRVSNGRVFELYYDRAPKNIDERQGAWFLKQELLEEV